MAALPTVIYSVEQIRALERIVIERGISSYTLMSRAGDAAFKEMREAWPTARQVALVCGGGNNAGDGYVLARLALRSGLVIKVIAMVAIEQLQGDARRAAEEFIASGGRTSMWSPSVLERSDVIVDAIFGTGLSREISEPFAAVIRCINASGKPVLSLDVPSGLDADTGRVLGIAVKATRTVTFVGLKLGFYVGMGMEHVGSLACDDLSTAPFAHTVTEIAHRMTRDDVKSLVRPRARLAHKGTSGHVLIIGGDAGMAGAVRLAGEAAIRVGAGLVSIATRSAHVAAIVSARPELMVHGVDVTADFEHLMERADVIAIGPGLGRSDWARELLQVVLASMKPVVADADALNLLAAMPAVRPHWIVTPHPGEAARLLQMDTAAIQRDRLLSAKKIAERFACVAVLKGAGTIVVDAAGTPAICDIGNPGMATAGTGDALTGIIASFVAQGLALPDAARAGVFVHAEAGDRAARKGERGMIASDLIAELRDVVNFDA